MQGCVNLREEEDGTFTDPITFEEIPDNRVVSFYRRNQKFCYDALTLLQSNASRQRLQLDNRGVRDLSFVLPETRDVLTSEEVEDLYAVARNSFPQVYMVANGDQVTDRVFPSESEAQDFATRQGSGNVFAIAETSDENIKLLYPKGLADLIPDFGIRDYVPAWSAEENAIRDDVFERPVPLAGGFERPSVPSRSPPPAPRRARRRPQNSFRTPPRRPRSLFFNGLESEELVNTGEEEYTQDGRYFRVVMTEGEIQCYNADNQPVECPPEIMARYLPRPPSLRRQSGHYEQRLYSNSMDRYYLYRDNHCYDEITGVEVDCPDDVVVQAWMS